MIYSFLGSGTYFVLNYLLLFIFARFSEPGVVGMFFIASSLINVMMILSLQGLSDGVLRYVSIYYGANDQARAKGIYIISILFVLFSSLIIALLLFVNARFLAHIFNKPGLEVLIRIFSFCLPLMAVNRIFMATFQGLRKIDYIAVFQGVLLPSLIIIIYLIAYFSGERFIGLGISYVISYLIICIIAFGALNNLLKWKAAISAEDCKALLSFSFPLTFVGLLSIASGKIDVLMLGWLKNTNDVGYYAIAFNLSMICAAFLGLVRYIYAPIVANLHGQNETATLDAVFKTITRWILTLSLPVYYILIINAQTIMQIFGKDYAVGTRPFILLCTSQLICAVIGLAGIMLPMIGKSFHACLNSFMFIFLNVILDLLLIPGYGIMGAAIGFSISLIFISFVAQLQIYQILRIHPYNSRIFVLTLCMGIIFIVSYIFNNIFPLGVRGQVLYSFVGLCIYAIIIARTIQQNDKEILRYMVFGSISKMKIYLGYNHYQSKL